MLHGFFQNPGQVSLQDSLLTWLLHFLKTINVCIDYLDPLKYLECIHKCVMKWFAVSWLGNISRSKGIFATPSVYKTWVSEKHCHFSSYPSQFTYAGGCTARWSDLLLLSPPLKQQAVPLQSSSSSQMAGSSIAPSLASDPLSEQTAYPENSQATGEQEAEWTNWEPVISNIVQEKFKHN